MPKIITVGNQKGGVGKSTTASNVAYALGMQGFNTLVIDADPQSNTTSVLLAQLTDRENFNLVKILSGKTASDTFSANACATRHEKIWIIPNTIQCSSWEKSVGSSLDAVVGFSRVLGIDQGAEKYDYIVIDSPPNLGIMVNNSLIISDYVIVPIPVSDQFALDGFGAYMELIKECSLQNKKLRLLGVLLTKYDARAATFRTNKEKLEAFFRGRGIPVFNTVIRVNIDLYKAQARRRTIFEHDGSKAGSQDYGALTQEIVALTQTE